jgi:NAD(P)-dependent dehydrogenase (short-subunit alcohol dehydrogenase family)
MLSEDVLRKYEYLEWEYGELLKGKVSLVTGGTGGIGSAISRKLARLGSTVYLNDIKEPKDLTDEINAQYSEVRAVPIRADIASKSEVKEMFKRVLDENGGVDILINNAAIYGEAPTNSLEISYEKFKKVISVDLSGTVYCTIAAIPQMRDKGWGRIMFTAAPLSSSGTPVPYLAGKSGFIGLTKYLSRKLKKYGIGTFAVVLRHVYTPMMRKVMQSRGMNVEDGRKALDQKSLTGRMATPEEISRMFAYFALPISDHMSGQTILADGGITYLR